MTGVRFKISSGQGCSRPQFFEDKVQTFLNKPLMADRTVFLYFYFIVMFISLPLLVLFSYHFCEFSPRSLLKKSALFALTGAKLLQLQPGASFNKQRHQHPALRRSAKAEICKAG
jgi:hypothetical protein